MNMPQWQPKQGGYVRIVTVCTGNICRSPLIAQVLRARLGSMPPAQAEQILIESAGTQATPGQTMPDLAIRSSIALGGDPHSHTARYLNEGSLHGATLVLTAERAHRARVVALAPSLLRRTFTLREFARLTHSVDEGELLSAMRNPLVADTSEARLIAALGLLADSRGLAPRPSEPADDDIVDPYRRSEATYERAAQQMEHGINSVHWVLTMPALWQA